MKNKKVIPAEIAEELLKSEDPNVALRGVVEFLRAKVTREWSHHLMGLWISFCVGMAMYALLIMFLFIIHVVLFLLFCVTLYLYHVV